MKKILIIVGLLALTAAACNQQPTSQTPTPPPTPVSTTPTTQTYTNGTYGFKFDYPTSMLFVTPTYANLEDKIVQVQIPQSTYPKTNFGDAALSVSSQFAKDLASCLKLSPPEGSDGFKTKATINGVNFYMTNSNGAGAGNFYEGKVYRTIKAAGGACIEVAETIHTGNIDNYPTGTVVEVDHTDVQAKLDTVLNSFKFTN